MVWELEPLGVEFVVQYVCGRIHGHLVDLHGSPFRVKGCAGQLDNRPLRRNGQPGRFLSGGHTDPHLLSETGWRVTKVPKTGVDAAWTCVGLRDRGPRYQRLRQIGLGDHDGAPGHQVSTTSYTHRLVWRQLKNRADVARRENAFRDRDLIDVWNTAVVCGPDRLAASPMPLGQSLQAATPDGIEGDYPGSGTLLCFDESLRPQDFQRPTGSKARYVVLLGECVLTGQAIARPVVTSFDRGFQLVSDLLGLGGRCVRLVCCHLSPYLSTDPRSDCYRGARGVPRRVRGCGAGYRLATHLGTEVVDITTEDAFH